MTDETDNEEEQQDEPEQKAAEPAPDPWKERALMAEANQVRLMEMLRERQQQPAQADVQPHVKPDYGELAERFGRPVDEVRGIASAAVAEVVASYDPRIARLEQQLQASQPTLQDKLETLAEKAGEGFDKWDAARAFENAKAALGDRATERQIQQKAIAELRASRAAETHRTAGTSAGSIPPGRRPVTTAKREESFIETIKKDQRKRGLYAY